MEQNNTENENLWINCFHLGNNVVDDNDIK